MAGNDVRHMTPEIHDLLTDRDVIALDQDPLGKQGFRALAEPGKNIEIWVKELSHGEWAVCALNTSNAAADLTVHWDQLWTVRGQFSLRDLWAKKDAGDNSKPYTAQVAPHDVLLFRLTPVKK